MIKLSTTSCTSLRIFTREAMTAQKIRLSPGAYAATLTFFVPGTENLDLDTLRQHIIRLAEAGLAGIVTLGSNGEAALLSNEERYQVTKTTRETLQSFGFGHLPVIVGTSAQSTKETIFLCHEAARAGGSHVLVLPPSYYKAAMTDDTIYDFYMEVASSSPLPVVLYSFPAVVAGIEMSSDLLIRISKGHPNIVGTKFTCADTGKLARVARAMHAMTPFGSETAEYWAVAGLADFTLQGLVAGSSGVIAGGANITPKACCKVMSLFKEGKLQEAMELQSLLAEGDWVHTAAGIPGTKQVLQSFLRYGGSPRSPLQRHPDKTISTLSQRMHELLELERRLTPMMRQNDNRT